MNLQLFNFNQNEIRIIKDEKGNPWFCGKDVCDALEIHWSGTKTFDSVKSAWQKVVKLPTIKGLRGFVFINEAALYKFAFRSNKPEAEVFTDWVAEDVLPSIRKTGTYTLSDYLQEKPRSWSKTFPDRYFECVLKLYGISYQNGTNPPQFVGKFTNEFVYGALDRRLPAELKRLRIDNEGIEEQYGKMHQYLNGEGKDVLEKHLERVVTLMEVASDIDHFRLLWKKSVTHRNQMEMYLR